MRAGVLAWGLVFISAAIGGFTTVQTPTDVGASNASLEGAGDGGITRLHVAP